MSETQASSPPVTPFDLSPGLLEYYSSQAEVMLAQYENINRLLGPTHDWTHPGDFCEILFRDFIRRFLSPALSADKGFFYGRATLEDKDTHCPEIDILIHDTQKHRPIFRMGDFVIVKPEAVRAMIQVKRTLSKTQVQNGVENIVKAKQHLLNVLWTEDYRGWGKWGLPPRIFTAVVGIGDDVGTDTEFYWKMLLEWSISYKKYNRPNTEPTNMCVLPCFIGSITSMFLMLQGSGHGWNPHYNLFQSYHGENNICIQAFLASMCHILGQEQEERPPFRWPADMKSVNDFYVLRIMRAELNPDGTITLYRNDNWRRNYRKTESVVNETPHVIRDASSQLTLTGLPKDSLHPSFIFVKHGSVVERYEQIMPDPLPAVPD
jgi:hypothetical protein